jgi:hypothetical protein
MCSNIPFIGAVLSCESTTSGVISTICPGTVVSNPDFFAIIFSAKVWGIGSPYHLWVETQGDKVHCLNTSKLCKVKIGEIGMVEDDGLRPAFELITLPRMSRNDMHYTIWDFVFEAQPHPGERMAQILIHTGPFIIAAFLAELNQFTNISQKCPSDEGIAVYTIAIAISFLQNVFHGNTEAANYTNMLWEGDIHVFY